MSSALTAWSDAFKMEKEALFTKVNKLKKELVSSQNHGSAAKFPELRGMYDANVSA